MRKVIAAINMTLDADCDHRSGIADDELHQHYADLLRHAGTLLYGRITYQLMEGYWPTLVKTPSGNKPMDDFAKIIDDIPKIVFSRKLTGVEWKSAQLAKAGIKETILELRQQPGKPILIGSRSLIIAAMNLNLIDEFQLCVHPVIIGSGLPLFENVHDRTVLKLMKTKTFGSGAITLYYEPTKHN